MDNPNPPRHTRRFFMVCLIVFLPLFLLLAAGYIDCVDAIPSLDVAESLRKTGSFIVAEQRFEGTFYGRDRFGQWRSVMGLTTPVLYAGCLWVGEQIERLFNRRHPLGIGAWVFLLNPVITSILFALMVTCFVKTFSFSHRRLFFFSSLIGTSLLVPYSKTCHREPLQALFLLGAYLPLLPELRERFRFGPVAGGISAALAILTKEALIVPLLPALYLAGTQSIWPKGKRAWYLVWPVVAIVSGIFYSQYFFNSWLPGGFASAVTHLSSSVWSTPFFAGFTEQWFSLRYGFFTLQPLFWLFLIAACANWKQSEASSRALLLAALLQSFFYAKWFTPIGKEALGPRFLVPIIPLILLAGRNWNFRFLKLKTYRLVAALLSVLALLNVVPQTAVKTQTYWTVIKQGALDPAPAQPSTFAVLLALKLLGQPDHYSSRYFGNYPERNIDLRSHRSHHGFNFWWSHWGRQGFPSAPPELLHRPL